MADDDRDGLGFEAGAAIFGAGILVVAPLWLGPRVSRTALFWAAFVLTRPLGATLGDLLDKPLAHGGLQFSRSSASGILFAFIIVCIVLIPHRAAYLQSGCRVANKEARSTIGALKR